MNTLLHIFFQSQLQCGLQKPCSYEYEYKTKASFEYNTREPPPRTTATGSRQYHACYCRPRGPHARYGNIEMRTTLVFPYGTRVISFSGPVASAAVIGLAGKRHASAHANGRAFAVIVSGASRGQSQGASGIGAAWNFIVDASQSIAKPNSPLGSASIGSANVRLPRVTSQKGRLLVVFWSPHGAAELNFLPSSPLPNVTRFRALISAGSVRLTVSPVDHRLSIRTNPFESGLASSTLPATVSSGPSLEQRHRVRKQLGGKSRFKRSCHHHAGIRSHSGKLAAALSTNVTSMMTVSSKG